MSTPNQQAARELIGGFAEQKEWIVNLDKDIHHIPFPFCFQCPLGKEKYENCGEECFRKGIGQLAEKGVGPESISGIITETFQGPTVAFMPDDYARAMRSWADENDIIVTFDEIQAGFGRTGKMFGFEHHGIEVDLICCGKGMTGSLPMSAVIGKSKILDVPGHGEMSSTNTGNPLCCAAALANIEVLQEEKLVENSAVMGKVMEAKLEELQATFGDVVGGFSGKGLAWAVYLVKPGTREFDTKLSDKVTDISMQRGLLMLKTGRGTLKLAPPLCIDEEAVVEGIDVIAEVLQECLG